MPVTVAPTVKMMVQLYASSSDEFIHHHGRVGAIRYLRLTAEGLQLQKQIAQQVLENPMEQLRELGSCCVAYEKDREALRNEYETLRSLGCEDIEWLETEELLLLPGSSEDFACAIFFPKDAIIDSSLYAKAVLAAAMKDRPDCHLVTNAKVTRVSEDNDWALVELESGDCIRCQHVVMATGGLFQIPPLNGLLKPCYSYLVHVPIATQSCLDSPNFFTWGYTHDWCFTNGSVRCSGEDHFSAYKAPQCQERCANLSKWTLETYRVANDDDIDFDSIPQQYGVYSETPDLVPLLGSLHSGSKVCYLVGCNAWGQTVLSYCASLVPGLLGVTELTESQRDKLKLLSVRRFSHLPAVQDLLD